MQGIRRILPAATVPVLLVLSGARWIVAGEVSGNARILAGTTDAVGAGQDTLEQQYSLLYREPISPWLDFLISYQASEFDLESQGMDFERDSQEPFLQLAYRRGAFNGRIGYRDRRNRGTTPEEVLDSDSTFAQFQWKPRRGPSYALRWTDSSDVADVAVFGRDVSTRLLEFDTTHFARRWNARYSLQSLDLDNRTTGFSLDQVRNLVQGAYENRFLRERLQLSTDWRFIRTAQDERAAPGTTLADPIPAVAGLEAVDLTPDIGSLNSIPTLIDTDTVTPAGPPQIDIGGANTFRNVGVDLGLSRPVTRLEITVDNLSDPGLAWQVYHGPDNLNWAAVAGVTSTFDTVFLRYTLEFPETVDRFFKAVNVSANSQVNVLVAEARALLDVQRTGAAERTATTVLGTVLARWAPPGRFGADLTLGVSDDSGEGTLVPTADSRNLTADALIRYAFTDTIVGRARYHRTDFERDQTPVLTREEERLSAALAWNPIPAVDALFTASRREETERGRRLRQSDTLEARAATILVPGLRVTSELAYTSVADPFSGFDLASWSWRETFDTRPLPDLEVFGGFTLEFFDAAGSVSLAERRTTNWSVAWNLDPLSFSAWWDLGREDDRDTLSQRYQVGWSPGSRLTASTSYASNDSSGATEIATWSAALTYQLDRNWSLFATASRSHLRQPVGGSDRVESAQFGMTVAF